jgi:hypothetical protein
MRLLFLILGRKISDLAFGEFLQILEWIFNELDKRGEIKWDAHQTDNI